jgi:hypothetical protein
MAVVMSVAAVDTYMHAAILGAIGSMDSTSPSSHLRGLDVRFGELVDLADATVKARRKEQDSRPRVQVKNALHRRLLRKTFQSSDQVADAMAYAGVTEGWSKVAKEMGEPVGALKAHLDRMVYRRNQIVHEGDLKRLVRPRSLSFNEVDRNEVTQDVDWVESLLDAIDVVLQQS